MEQKKDIEIFIDGITNHAESNKALKEAAERLKGKELFKESNDRARKILSEIKSLPIQERSYSEEDMLKSFMACWKANVPEGFECKLSFKEWFEQFKKNQNV